MGEKKSWMLFNSNTVDEATVLPLAVMQTWTRMRYIFISWPERYMKTSSCVQAQFYKEQKVTASCVCVHMCLCPHRMQSGRVHTSLFCSHCGVEAGQERKRSPSYFMYFFIIWFCKDCHSLQTDYFSSVQKIPLS